MRFFMKKFILLFAALLMFDVAAPFLQTKKEKTAPPAVETTAAPQTTAALTLPALSENASQDDGADLARYIGVTAALMPAEYEPEALKAQALAAITYDKYRDETGRTLPALPCADGDALREQWGGRYEEYYKKFSDAVGDVRRCRITYQGKPILALSFPLCAGQTEDAKKALGVELPYLVPVPSPGDRLAPGLTSEKTFESSEFRALLGLDADAPETVGVEEASEAGTVLRVAAGGKEFTGAEFVEALGLDSAAFSVGFKNGKYTVSVTGKGNFVGMSRYGADFMARQGADFREILTHYFPGTEIESDEK